MLLRTLVVAGLVGALLTLVPTEAQAAKAKKKKSHPVRGVIESVSPEKDKGTLVVKVHQGKKKKAAAGEAAKPLEKKFTFGPDTKVELAKGKKETAPGSLSDLKAGQHVRVTAKDDKAEKIVVREGKKKKKKSNT